MKKRTTILTFLVGMLALTLGVPLGTGTSLAAAPVILGPGGFHIIVNPGLYKVVGTETGIDVRASNVHINPSQGVVDCTSDNAMGINISNQTGVHINASLTGTVRTCRMGIRILGGGSHQINGVISRNNRQNGFLIGNGTTNNRFIGNDTRNNGQNGIAMGGAGTNGNHISGNLSTNNGRNGITVGGGGSTNNRITENIAQNNNQAAGAFVDLREANPDCTFNKWSDNTFNTSNLRCIQ